MNMRLSSIGAAVMSALSCQAVVVANPNGMLEASSVSELQGKVDASGADGLVLGNGMLKWTGSGTSVWDGTYTSAPVSNLEVTVNVTDPDATLKIAGAAVAQTDGVFLKSGSGTVEFSGGGVLGAVTGSTPWDAGWWKTYDGTASAAFQAGLPVWDETTGIVSGYGYSTFSVLEGTLRLNAPGKTFNIPTTPWVGGRLQASPRWEITNHTAAVSGSGVFSIARGTGTKTNAEAPVVSIADGGSLQVAALSMGYSNGDANHYSRARLELDHGTFTTSGNIDQPQSSGRPVVSVANGSLFNQTRNSGLSDGWQMRSDAETYITGCSTGVAEEVSHLNGTTRMEVTAGSVFKLNRMIPSFYNSFALNGPCAALVRFDDATLTRVDDVIGEWFGTRGNGYTNFVVGANGMTMDVDGPVWFGAQPVAEAETAQIVKTGADTLFTRPFTNVAVTVAEGMLGLTMPNSVWTNDAKMTRTFAAGTKMLVAGEGALGGAEIAVPDGFEAKFIDGGKSENVEWVCKNWSQRLFDGTLQMTYGNLGSGGAAWRSEKVSVAESFTVTFDSFSRLGDCATIEPYYGWALVFQNKGTDRYGSTGVDGNNFGYSGDNVVSGVNYGFTAPDVKSWAIGINVKNCTFGVGSNGSTMTVSPAMGGGVTKTDLAASVEVPCRNVFTYDATTHKAALTVYVPSVGRIFWHEANVDFEELLGAAEAYVGFTAATHSARNCEHCIRNFAYVPATSGAKRAVVHVGGNLTLGNGGTFKASVAGNDAVGTFAVDSIAGSGAVTLDVDDASVYPASVLMPLSSTSSACWEFGEYGCMTDEGPSCSQGAKMPGGFASTQAYPIAGDWTISYDWKADNGGTLADVMFFMLDNLTATNKNSTTSAGGLRFRIVMYGPRADGNTGDIFKVMIEKNAVDQMIGADGGSYLDLSVDDQGVEWFSLKNKGTLHVVFAYDDTAKTLAITLSQQDGAVSHTITLTDFDAVETFKANAVRFRGYQAVGGLYAKGIFANVAWEGAGYAAATAVKPKSEFAAERLSGVTSVVKKGTADLAFLEPGQWNVPLTVEAGGLRFAKEPLEDVVIGAGGGWIFNQPSGCYTAKCGVKIGTDVNNHADVAQLRHKVRVSGKWKASWTLRNITATSGDTLAFFIHNDPRGNNIVGTYNYAATYTIKKMCGIGWNCDRFGAGDRMNKVNFVTKDAYFQWLQGVSLEPVNFITGGDTETILEYDGAGTMKVTHRQGANVSVITQTGFDVKASVGDDYAYIGFGAGGGGARVYPSFDDFKFELLDSVDTLADARYLPSLTVANDTTIMLDSPVEGGSFNAADALTIADGKTLTVRAANASAVLKTAELTLGEGSVVSGDPSVTVTAASVRNAAETLTVDGVVFTLPAADVASGAFDGKTINLLNGAKLSLPAGTCRLGEIYVDGIRQKHRVYTAGTCDWIVGAGSIDVSRGMLVIIK